MTENINDRSEKEFASVEDPLNMHRTASIETTLVSEIPKCYYCTRARKKIISILCVEFCEERAFPHLLPKGKFGYNAP